MWREGPTRGASRGWRRAALALSIPLLLPAVAARAQRVDYSGAVQGWTGEYFFTERTTSFAVINGLSLDVGRLRLSASIPLLVQNSTALTYVGGMPVPTGGPDAPVVRERTGGQAVPMGPGGSHGSGPGGSGGQGGPGGQGGQGGRSLSIAAQVQDTTALAVVASPGSYQANLGDPMFAADVTLHEGTGALRRLAVHALAKAPVADVESGVGTGAWDYGGGVSLGVGGARTSLLADASYWVIGDMPGLPLRNTLSYAVSVARSLGAGRWSMFGSLLGGTAMIANTDPPVSVGLGVGYSWRDAGGVTLGVNAGLTETSPDLSVLLGWRVGLGPSGR